MSVARQFPIDPVPDHWCWIGEDDSAYLQGLIDWLQSRRGRAGQTSDFHVQLINVSSSKKRRKVLVKAKTDVVIWSVDQEAITGLIQDIAWFQGVQPSVLQIVAGPASTAERTFLFEAGASWHVERANQW